MKYNIYKLSFTQRLERLNLAYVQDIYKLEKKGLHPTEKLHVVYVLSNPSICGASKIIFEQADRLINKGARVTIVSYAPKPVWYPVHASFIKASSRIRLAAAIPECDVIVATYYTHIQECIETEIAPVVYFEQGDVHLFNFKALEKKHKEFVFRQYQLPQFIMTVSESAAKLINKYFGRKAEVFSNAIDHTVFSALRQIRGHTDTRQVDLAFDKKALTSADMQAKQSKDKSKYILIIGRDDIPFKGIHFLIETYEKIKEKYKDLLLYWVTPYLKENTFSERATKIIVAPSPEELALLYQNAFVYISGSRYESFSLCVIEAMACGCPVITAKNTGVSDYGINGHNLLVYNPFNTKELINRIERLQENESLRDRVILNGHITAERYEWEAVISQLYKYFGNISLYRVKSRKKDLLLGEVNTVQEILNYAVELYDNRQFDEAINFFNEFIELFDGDIEKKLFAERKRYLSYYLKKDIKMVRSLCFNCFEYSRPRAEECYFIGLTYLEEKLYDLSIFWFEMAVNATRGEDYFIEDEAIWTWKPHLQLCICYYRKGEIEKAIHHNELAFKYAPDNESVLHNRRFFSSVRE